MDTAKKEPKTAKEMTPDDREKEFVRRLHQEIDRIVLEQSKLSPAERQSTSKPKQ